MNTSELLDEPRDIASVAFYRREPQETPQEAHHRRLLREALQRFAKVKSYESEWRRKAEEELKFVDELAHWDPKMVEERKGLPCFAFDRIGPAIDQVVNDMRQNPPEPRVTPVGGNADKETAAIILGMIRNIDNDSDAEIAYMTGYEHAVKVGRGWQRVDFQYEDESDENNWFQKLKIDRIPNLFSVYPDPASEDFEYGDMMYCFVTEDVEKSAFEAEHPNIPATGQSDFAGQGDLVRDWFPKGSVRVAEYWWVELQDKTIHMFADGTVGAFPHPLNVESMSSRTIKKRIVHFAKITGTHVLEESVWPGRYIPLIPTIGRESIIDGKRKWRGMIRSAMDANLAYDYARSKEIETVTLSAISQWLIAEGQIEGYEYLWADANRKPVAYLTYKTQVGQDNKTVPPPIRITPSVVSSATEAAITHADGDVKAQLNTWDANLGAPGPEQSGRAILARQREGDNAHFHYHDNLNRAMRQIARVIVDLIPYIYTEPQAMSIFNPDGSTRDVVINAPFVEKGLQRVFMVNDPTKRFHITAASGPSYASRRQEAGYALLELGKAMPEVMGRAADLIVKVLDIPEADQLAARLRPKDVPPEDDNAPLTPEWQMKFAELTQQNQQLIQSVHALADKIERRQADIDSRERIAAHHESQENLRAIIKAHSADAQALLQAETEAIADQQSLLHQVLPLVASDQPRQPQQSS